MAIWGEIEREDDVSTSANDEISLAITSEVRSEACHVLTTG